MRAGRSAATDWHRSVVRAAGRVDAALLRRVGISALTLLRRRPVLLLETTGRRSGRTRYTALAYWTDIDATPCVGGGAAGLAQVDWIANLRAHPDAAIWIRRRRHLVVATELFGEEQAAARRHARALWPETAWFERRSGRPLPCFRLGASGGATDGTSRERPEPTC